MKLFILAGLGENIYEIAPKFIIKLLDIECFKLNEHLGKSKIKYTNIVLFL
jgi:hypothetical protein